MPRRTVLRSVAVILGWLIAASLFVVVPRADAVAADETSPLIVAEAGSSGPEPIGGNESAAGFAVSSFGGAVALLANTPAGTPCTYTDPDTNVDYDGTIDIRQVGQDHNDYDGNGNFNDTDDELVELYREDFGVIPIAPAGYRYEFEVCVSNAWPWEPLSVDWHGTPFELVLAENAVAWFETVRDAAFEDAFTDKAPGWRTWPDRAHMQIVSLDTWLYIENYYGTLSSSKILNASEGDQIQVTVEAVPTHSEWWVKKTGIDEEDTFTCSLGAGQGVAWAPNASGDKCGLVWDHSSPVIGAIDMRVRLIYDVTIYSQTLNNDGANQTAGQSFSQSIPGHTGQWDVHPDGSVPQDYKLYVSEVLANGFDATGEAQSGDRAAAPLGATPGGAQIGPSDSCWGPDVRCRVVAAVGGAILDFIVPEHIRRLVQGCWEGAKSAAVGFADLLSNLNPTTWDDKIAEMNELKDVLLEAHEAGELLDVLTDMGLQAGFDSLRLDMFDTVGDGNFGDLDFSDSLVWAEWIGAVGCEYLIGLFTGKAQQKIDDLLTNTRNRPNNENDTDTNDDGTPNDDDDGTPNDDDDSANDDDDSANDDDDPIICGFGESFPSGTPVRMADGSHLAIELIAPGDHVLSYDVSSQTWRPQQVTHQWSAIDTGHMTTLTLVDGVTITATDHHPFWVESDQTWRTIDALAGGDMLLTPAGTTMVDFIVTDPKAETLVWELSVAEDHNFAVAAGEHDLLAHNVDPDCNDADGGDRNPDGSWKRDEVPEDRAVGVTDDDGNPITHTDDNGDDIRDLRPQGEIDERAQEILDNIGDENRNLGRFTDMEEGVVDTDGEWNLFEEDWSPELNEAVMDALMDDGQPITLRSTPDAALHAGSVYADELAQLKARGWWPPVDNGDGTWTVSAPG